MEKKNEPTVDIKRLRELESKATIGPWEVNTLAGRPNREIFSVFDDNIGDFGCGGLGFEATEANAEFVVAARNAIPTLLDEIEQKQVHVVVLEHQIALLPDGWKFRAEAAEARVVELEHTHSKLLSVIECANATARRRGDQRDALQAKLDEVQGIVGPTPKRGGLPIVSQIREVLDN